MPESAAEEPAIMRPREAMPSFVEEALSEQKLRSAYNGRPPYQRNDYLIWINRAKREETRGKRLSQMLDELRRGDVYMNMPWSGRIKGSRAKAHPGRASPAARD